jgi:hypothetical protein
METLELAPQHDQTGFQTFDERAHWLCFLSDDIVCSVGVSEGCSQAANVRLVVCVTSRFFVVQLHRG